MYYTISNVIASVLCFIGIFLGFYYNIRGDKYKGISLFAQIAIIPMAINAFITHTFFRGNVIKSQPFFEIEAGGANLGIGISLIVLSILKVPINAIAGVLLVYAIYLTVAMICSYIYISKQRSLKFIPILVVLYYFSILGLID